MVAMNFISEKSTFITFSLAFVHLNFFLALCHFVDYLTILLDRYLVRSFAYYQSKLYTLYIYVVYLITLVYTSILCQYCIHFTALALFQSLEQQSLFISFAQDCFWCLFFLLIPCEVQNFSIYVKNVVGILIRLAMNLHIALGKIIIFTMLILPLQEHWMSSHFLVPFSSFLKTCYTFSSLKPITSLIRFILRYFSFFEAMVDGMEFLISFSVCLLLVHGKTTGLFKLILYSVTLLGWFIISRTFLLNVLDLQYVV